MRLKTESLTSRQIQIASLYIGHEFTQKEIAEKLGITQPAVSKQIKIMGIKRPKNITKRKILRFDEIRDYKVIKQF